MQLHPVKGAEEKKSTDVFFVTLIQSSFTDSLCLLIKIFVYCSDSIAGDW